MNDTFDMKPDEIKARFADDPDLGPFKVTVTLSKFAAQRQLDRILQHTTFMILTDKDKIRAIFLLERNICSTFGIPWYNDIHEKLSIIIED